MSGYIRVLKEVSAVGAGGEVGCVASDRKYAGMYIIFCNKISCQKKKELLNVQDNWHCCSHLSVYKLLNALSKLYKASQRQWTSSIFANVYLLAQALKIRGFLFSY